MHHIGVNYIFLNNDDPESKSYTTSSTNPTTTNPYPIRRQHKSEIMECKHVCNKVCNNVNDVRNVISPL